MRPATLPKEYRMPTLVNYRFSVTYANVPPIDLTPDDADWILDAWMATAPDTHPVASASTKRHTVDVSFSMEAESMGTAEAAAFECIRQAFSAMPSTSREDMRVVGRSVVVADFDL